MADTQEDNWTSTCQVLADGISANSPLVEVSYVGSPKSNGRETDTPMGVGRSMNISEQ